MSQKVFSKDLAPSASNSDMFLIDPREVLIREEYNGRHEEPDCDDLIADFLDPKIGQNTPVIITKDDGRPVLIAGHRRWRAAMHVTKQKQGPFGGVFKVKCVYFRGTPLECFILTVKENRNRKEPKPIDDGYNISKFKNFGLSDEEIAKIYGVQTLDGKPDTKWIEDRAALVDLTPEAQEAVAAGRVKPSAVSALAKLRKQAQKDLLKDKEVKITTAAIKRAAAPQPSATTSEAYPTPPAKRKWDKKAFLEVLRRFSDATLPPHIAKMSPENAIREVLSQILDEIECGQ